MTKPKLIHSAEDKDAKHAAFGGAESGKVCSSCIFWDRETKNENELLHHPYQKHTEFGCRFLPQLTYKKATEWCGQHKAG